jgi:hypothetical protein
MGTNGNWRKLDITHLEPHCYPNDLTHTKVGMEITHRSLGEHPKSHGFSLSFPEKKMLFYGHSPFLDTPKHIKHHILSIFPLYIFPLYQKKIPMIWVIYDYIQ